MNETELRRLSELRALLEGFAARHAAARAASAPETLDRLRLVLHRLSQAARARDYPAFRQADFELHETMIDLAAVPLLHEAWLTVWNGLLDFHEKGFEDCFPDVRVLGEEHEYLVDTIALGDPAAAEDAARSHIEAVWYRRAEQYGTAAASGVDTLLRATAHVAFRMHCPLRLTEVAAGRLHQPRQPIAAVPATSRRQLPGLLAEGPPGKGCRTASFHASASSPHRPPRRLPRRLAIRPALQTAVPGLSHRVSAEFSVAG